jgi:hypothetical protein
MGDLGRGVSGTSLLTLSAKPSETAEGEDEMLNAIKILATASAAFCWFKSSRVALTPIAPGMEELDKVTLLAGNLQKMGNWNFYAATSACVAAVMELIVWVI